MLELHSPNPVAQPRLRNPAYNTGHPIMVLLSDSQGLHKAAAAAASRLSSMVVYAPALLPLLAQPPSALSH
jgi:dienelactone hydrolase